MEKLATKIQEINKQIKSFSKDTYVKKSGSNYVINVRKLSSKRKLELEALINKFMSSKATVRELESKRRALLNEIIKQART